MSIKVIELFSGIGAQNKGLKKTGLDYEIVATAEIDKEATLSYAAVHKDLENEEKGNRAMPSLQEMADFLAVRNIGFNFKKGLPYDWVKMAKSKSDSQHKLLKRYYLASVLSNNLGDISKIERLPVADFWTYSFPCQDISVAGKQAGMTKETRSGLLYQVERLLEVAKIKNELPKYLMLENVKNLVGKKFKGQFEAWLEKLDSLGYNTYWQVLNAKNYGVPQNRERVFAISVRKDIDQGFQFPKPFDNEIRLKDILEKEVDEKYYINKKWHISSEEDEKHDVTEITQIDNGNYKATRSIGDINKICRCLDTMGGGQREPKILEPELQKIDINQQVRVRKNKANIDGLKKLLREKKKSSGLTNKTISLKIEEPITRVEHWFRGDSSFAIPSENKWLALKKLIGIETKEFDKEILEFIEKPGVYEKASRVYLDTGLCPTLTCASEQEKILVNYRIRKLTPLECWRLMGFADVDFYKAQEYMSNSALYKQAGNSIVVDVLYYIFKNLFEEEIRCQN